MVGLQSVPGFPVMTLPAEWLPVCFIPEQALVAPVWDDVVNHGRGRVFALREALHTQWVPVQEGQPSLSPSGSRDQAILFTALASLETLRAVMFL